MRFVATRHAEGNDEAIAAVTQPTRRNVVAECVCEIGNANF